MKKFLKGFLCFVVSFAVLFNFTACSTPLSETTVDYSKAIYNGESTNGGVTVIYDGYLYFINGIKDNDGTSATGNKRSAIYRVKIDDDGVIDEDTYELVVDNLVGYDNGSIFIFGDFLYFATPNDEVNYQDTKLNYQTKFMRYDLVNKKSYEIYTTKQNSSSESISYSYYIVNNSLYLIVFESTNATLTSLKIDSEITTAYVIEDVDSCVMSENYGECVTDGASVDANNFVFYTKSPESYEYPQDGNYTYKVSPESDNSVCISNDKKSVSLLSIRNGKLVYSVTSINASEDIIYYQTITNSQTETLTFSNVISYKTQENIVFIENDDGSISCVCLDEDTNEIVVYYSSSDNSQDITGVVVNTITISSSSTLSFVGVVTLSEEVESDDDSTGTGTEIGTEEGNEEVETVDVVYLIYIESNVVYKIEIMRDGVVSKFNDPIKLSTSTASTPSGYLVPEIIGNYLYFYASELVEEDGSTSEGDNTYLFRLDLTIEDDSTEYATMIAVTED